LEVKKIDKQYSQWLDIYNTLFETNHDYRNVMSSGSAITAFDGTITTGAQQTVYIPLRFWFNRNPGLALPLIALQYHEVKINIDLSATPTLTCGAADVGNGFTATAVLDEATLLVNYLYLDTDERRRFAQVSHEYLIEQVQHTGDETLATGKGKLTLNFNHPVKCLAWVSSESSDNANAALKNAKLQLNGHDRAAQQLGSYYQLVQPYECGLGHSDTMNAGTRKWADSANGGGPGAAWVYLYSFALKPGEHQPSGTCNFSRIDNAVLQVEHQTGSVSTNVSVHAVNYNVLRVMSGMGGLAYSN
jgi:hypothetical protein